jgi:hypothetical protein
MQPSVTAVASSLQSIQQLLKLLNCSHSKHVVGSHGCESPVESYLVVNDSSAMCSFCLSLLAVLSVACALR